MSPENIFRLHLILGYVACRWRDSRRHNIQRRMTLSVHEFLRRFLLHVLPIGFVRIRYFGLFAHRRRNQLLPLCLTLLAASTPHRTAHAPTAAPPGLSACAIVADRCRSLSDSRRSKSGCGRRQKSKLQMTRSFSTLIVRRPRWHRLTCVRVAGESDYDRSHRSADHLDREPWLIIGPWSSPNLAGVVGFQTP